MERKGPLTHLATEDQAAKLWCPMARLAINPGDSCNRWSPMTDVDGVGCMGSRCMFWRWSDPAPRKQWQSHRGPRPPDDRPGWVEDSWEYSRTLTEVDRDEQGESPARLADMRAKYVWNRELDPLPPRGYCGMVPVPATISRE